MRRNSASIVQAALDGIFDHSMALSMLEVQIATLGEALESHRRVAKTREQNEAYRVAAHHMLTAAKRLESAMNLLNLAENALHEGA